MLIESDFYDTEIKVGAEQDDIRIFNAHSCILKARSSYFKAALSNNWANKSEDGNFLFEKDNISSRTFGIILI